MEGTEKVPIWVPATMLLLLPNRVPGMFPKLLPHGSDTVPSICFWEQKGSGSGA